MTVIAGI